MAFILTETAIVFIKVVAFIVAGLLVGIGGKIALRRYLQRKFLRKVLQHEPSVYSHISLLIKIFTEAFQWITIVVFLNYSLLQLNIQFLNTVIGYIGEYIYQILFFIVVVSVGILISRIIAAKIRKKEIQNADQISLVVEFVILFAFTLTGFEFIGIKATALSDLYRVLLYVIGAIVVIVTSASFIKGNVSIHKKK